MGQSGGTRKRCAPTRDPTKRFKRLERRPTTSPPLPHPQAGELCPAARRNSRSGPILQSLAAVIAHPESVPAAAGAGSGHVASSSAAPAS